MKRGQAVAALALLAMGCARERVEVPSAAVRPEPIEGVVVGFTGNELLVDEGSPGCPLAEVWVDETTHWVGPGGEAIDPGALEEGDQVRVFYGPLYGDLQVASRVEVACDALPGPPGVPAPLPAAGPEVPPASPDVVPDPLP